MFSKISCDRQYTYIHLRRRNAVTAVLLTKFFFLPLAWNIAIHVNLSNVSFLSILEFTHVNGFSSGASVSISWGISLLTFWGWISSVQMIIRLLIDSYFNAACGKIEICHLMPGFFPVVVASRRLHIHQFWGTEEGFASVQCFQTFIKRICWQQRKVSIVTEVPFFSSEMQNHLNCSVMVGKKNWHMSALMPWNYIYEFEINGDYRKICKNYRIAEL